MNRLNNEASLMLAKLLALKLALDLDAGDTSSLDMIGTIFLDLPLEASLIAVRTQLTMERCVKYNLDSHKIWSKVFEAHNK